MSFKHYMAKAVSVSSLTASVNSVITKRYRRNRKFKIIFVYFDICSVLFSVSIFQSHRQDCHIHRVYVTVNAVIRQSQAQTMNLQNS